MSGTMSEKTMKLRHLPGTKVEDLYKGWPKLALSEMEGTLAVQQYLETIRRTEPNNTTIVSEVPPGQDEAVWQYEWLRIFTLELNLLAVRLDSECSIESCKQMKASDEWLYLCAAHKTPQECSAVDYIRHTLDGTAALLNSNKWFPSRYVMLTCSAMIYSPFLLISASLMSSESTCIHPCAS
eukprot:TRINITY_DN8021_c0_g1_i2.p1 TRINITY_DN8021_c0_g1~~TRINITY_DN8021_c0_g1_i2.p1  ORF type:complete len:182 (-),score=28.14 TRINITY_DN8021_c0_g1_i2:170-715(-)